MLAKFQEYKNVSDYEKNGLDLVKPMLAKEADTEEKQDLLYNDNKNIIEQKLDGTRVTLHFTAEGIRCFSRRISDVTGWMCENTDSVPHIRDLDMKGLEGTILDGEFFIPNREFKDVSSTLNCLWEKAVARQEKLGKIVFNAFDILQFKHINIEKLPLHRRKQYLNHVINNIMKSDYLKTIKYYHCGEKIPVQIIATSNEVNKDKYPTLYKEMAEHDSKLKSSWYKISPKAFYELQIAKGLEGVMIKSETGRYLRDSRGWEYTKIKKILTKDVIVMGYSEPTRDYKGKFPTVDKWDYWETCEHDIVDLEGESQEYRDNFLKNWSYDLISPISKHFAKGWIGQIQFGVIITDEEFKKLPKNKKFVTEQMWSYIPPVDVGAQKVVNVLYVGECGGFDEEVREYITNNQEKLKYSVIEIKANEIFKDTGKLRHPRFHRFRPDKDRSECTWKDHINEEVIY